MGKRVILLSILLAALIGCVPVQNTVPVSPTPSQELQKVDPALVNILDAMQAVTEAAEMLDQAAILGKIKRDSTQYHTLKRTILDARDAVVLAKMYYEEGNLPDSRAAAQFGLDLYWSIRPVLVDLSKQEKI